MQHLVRTRSGVWSAVMRRTRSGFLRPVMARLRNGTSRLMLGRARSEAGNLMVGWTRGGAFRLMTDRTQSGPSSYELVRKRIGASRMVMALSSCESRQRMMDRIEGTEGPLLQRKSVKERSHHRAGGCSVGCNREPCALRHFIAWRGELLDPVSMAWPAKLMRDRDSGPRKCPGT